MSLVYNTNISKTEYLVDLENNGKAKQTALLSMSSTAPSGTFQKGSQYFNSTDKKIYTAVEDNVWGTTGKDPNFGVIYQCNNDYYVWDGDNLITTDLEGYEKLVNKATNFNTINNTKYPTTKAVADYVVKESIVRNFTDAGITKTTSSDVFSDRTNNTGLAEEILAKQFPTGTTLYGEVRNQGMPTGIGNAEIRVEILETKSNGAQVIEFTLFSVDIEPKEWSHIYFSARTEQQNPWVWIPKAVPTDDYTSNATTTVPTSKALSDGLNASFPTIVTDSGSSLPSASGYNEGDTFLNSTTKKIYQTETTITGYQLNTNVQNNATIDLQTGIVNGFVAASGSNKKSIINMNTDFLWKDNILLEIHFKLNTYDDYMVLLNSHTGGYNNKEIVLYLKDRKLYCSYMYGDPGPIHTYTFFTLANYQLSTNIEYFIKINKNGTNITTSIFTQGYDINKEYEETITNIEDWYIEGINSSTIEYGFYSNGPLENSYSPKAFDGDVYLADSIGDFLIPTSSISWNNGTDLLNKTEYVDKTNGILYIYKDNELLAINIASTFASITGQPSDNTALNTVLNSKQDKNLLFTNKSASTWVTDNTYPDYAYKCVISCTGVTANTYAIINFAQTEADSGNYATVCETGNGTVTIYSKVDDTITIPSIVVMGV